jgi:hypothetical protein
VRNGNSLRVLAVILAVPLLSQSGAITVAVADEGGVSFWLPGQYGSYAAAPAKPGWSFESTFYYAAASATASASFSRGGRIDAGLKSPIGIFMFTPTYSFETPVLGAQAALGMTAVFGKNSSTASATLTGPGGGTLSGTRSDDVAGFGDLYPTASLKWNRDNHNVMVYAATGVPVGAYSTTRISALGIGHWAVDSGAGYTYLNEQAGFEWSALLGFTYNFINPYTQYQSGVDAHLDWAISPYVTDKLHLGAVGYFYNQVTGDSGPGATLGGFKSRVAAIGPQIGFFIPVAERQGYLNLRAYYEFDASHRLNGWNTFITFSVEPPEQKSSSSTTKR